MTRAALIVLWIAVLVVQPSVGIVNKKKNTSRPYPPHFYPRREYFKRKSYLKVDRPLWVLEDKVTRPGEVEIATHRPFQSKRRFISPAPYVPKLPSHYANLDSTTPAPLRSPPTPQRVSSTKIFPVFDDFEAESEPILIYRGPKAEMIFNTMMTSRQYPMKEPVPGQVMYPPYSPKFKPTPVVERVRSNGYPESVFHNVTLIPFYAHEAVDPRQLKYEPEREVADNIQEESQNYLTDEEDREAACYHSYYSQDDVQSQYWAPQYTTSRPPEATTPMGLQRQLAIPNGVYSNHRMEATTAMPQNDFRITYDSRESEPPREPRPVPQKRYKTVHTAKYGGFKTIYPIYTLNKLLKYKPLKQAQKPSRRSDDLAERKSPPEETWLIWDARHKTAHASNYLNPMSGKRHSTLDTKILVQ